MKSWYLIRTKPGRDAVAETHLSNQGYCIYRPLVTRNKKRRGRLVTVSESLFPGYLFIELDETLDNWAPVRSTRGVSAFVCFGTKPAIVADWIIEGIREREADYASRMSDMDSFKPGDAVRIDQGAFNGIAAIFQRYDGKERAIVLLTLMQRETEIGLPVEVLDKSA